MKPDFQIKNVKLYNCDCMDFMKEIPDNYFNLSICDPPYGIGVAKAKEIGYKGFNQFTPKDWDNAIPDEEYFRELMRVSENQIIWGGNYFYLPPTRCFLVWDKGEGFIIELMQNANWLGLHLIKIPSNIKETLWPRVIIMGKSTQPRNPLLYINGF